MWIVGFDCAHWSDTPETCPKEFVEAETEDLKKQLILKTKQLETNGYKHTNTMSTQKATHTKWIVDSNKNLPLAVIEDTEDGYGICEIDTVHINAKANARLISAAPDMLEALKECSIELFAFLNSCDEREIKDSFLDMEITRDKTDKLIAKVEGK